MNLLFIIGAGTKTPGITMETKHRVYRELDDEVKQKISLSSRNKPKSEQHKHLNVRAEKVNEGFVQFVSTLKPNKAILALYKEILNDIRGENVREMEAKATQLQKESDAITERINRVQDLYFDGEITKEEKIAAIERYNKEQTKLNNQIASIRLGADSQMKKKLSYSINLIENIGDFFRYAAPEVKIKLLGSMFPEKIEFDGESFRTKAINEGQCVISYDGFPAFFPNVSKSRMAGREESPSGELPAAPSRRRLFITAAVPF